MSISAVRARMAIAPDAAYPKDRLKKVYAGPSSTVEDIPLKSDLFFSPNLAAVNLSYSRPPGQPGANADDVIDITTQLTAKYGEPLRVSENCGVPYEQTTGMCQITWSHVGQKVTMSYILRIGNDDQIEMLIIRYQPLSGDL